MKRLEKVSVLRCSEMGPTVLTGGISRQEASVQSGMLLEEGSVLSFKSRVEEGTASREK